MSRSTQPVEATFYLQVEPEWGRATRAFDDDGERPLRSAKAARMTLTRPHQPKPGTVLVKLTVRLPASAFYPLRPEATIIVPEGYSEATPLEVVALDPHQHAETSDGR